MMHDPTQKQQQQTLQTQDYVVINNFQCLLESLKGPDADIIKSLTDYTHNNFKYAYEFASDIGRRLITCNLSYKLPVCYLMDSIMKRVGGPFAEYFSKVSRD